MSVIKILLCLSLLASFAGCSSSSKEKDARKHETAGQYVDDSVITTRVKAALFNEDSLKSTDIKVKTYKGIVQLSGFVDTADEVEKAGEVAKNIDNVSSVQNNIIVK